MRDREDRSRKRLETMIESLESMLLHRQAHPTTRSEELYYRMMLDYWGRVLRAREEGKLLAAVSTLMPVEILHLFDRLVPFALERSASAPWSCWGTSPSFTPRLPPAALRSRSALPTAPWWGCIAGGVPRPDMVLWSSMVCDNTAKVGYAPADHFGVPTYLFDHPYRSSEPEVAYFVSQLTQGIRFLEEQTGHEASEGGCNP